MLFFKRPTFAKKGQTLTYQDLVMDRLRKKSLLGERTKPFSPYILKMLKIRFSRMD